MTLLVRVGPGLRLPVRTTVSCGLVFVTMGLGLNPHCFSSVSVCVGCDTNPCNGSSHACGCVLLTHVFVGVFFVFSRRLIITTPLF
jgi:hypothetical protein